MFKVNFFYKGAFLGFIVGNILVNIVPKYLLLKVMGVDFKFYILVISILLGMLLYSLFKLKKDEMANEGKR